MNHTYLVLAIDKLLESSNNSGILNFFIKFKKIAKNLIKSKNKEYIDVLINMIEK